MNSKEAWVLSTLNGKISHDNKTINYTLHKFKHGDIIGVLLDTIKG
jgi:hypothetical protein